MWLLRLNSEVMVNVQLPVPVQLDAEPVPFDQPVKVEPVLAVALKVMLVPWSAVHVPVLPYQRLSQKKMWLLELLLYWQGRTLSSQCHS
jgi:hypothetical protein